MGPVISKQLRLSRRGLLLGTVPASLALAACAPESSPIKKIENTKPSATPAHSETSPLSSPLKSDPKRWGFVGDSTSAAGVARAFAEVTGLPVSDSSIAGTTSLNALARTGAFDFKCSLENNTLKGSDKTKVLDVTPVNPFLSNGWDFSASINGVPGSIVRDYDTSEMLFTPDKPGKDIENLVNPPLKLDPYGPTNPFTQVTTNGYSMIIGLGRNDLKANGPSVDEVIDNIKSIIDQNIAEDVNYVVWDVPPWSWNTPGTQGRQDLDEWNNRLAEEFQDRFIPVAKMIIDRYEESFKLVNLIPTETDIEMAKNGTTPRSLCNDDDGHYNSMGCRVWAQYMVAEMKSRKFI